MRRKGSSAAMAAVSLVLFTGACSPDRSAADPAQAENGTALTTSDVQQSASSEEGAEAAAEALQSLYADLKQFKDDPQFHQVGFGQCCEYFRWKQKVEALSATHGRAILKRAGFAPGDLVQLASAYAKSRGRETDLTRRLKAPIENGLSPSKPSGGSGVLRTNGRWCTDVEVFADFVKGMETGAMDLASRPETDSSCREYASGTKVGPVLAERQFRFSDGTPFLRFVQVQAPDGTKIWVSDREVEF